jgi:putative N6-adenine-specific DNA methylase
VRVFAHLAAETVTLYIDTSGEPLFKRGWREDKGEAPLKETLAAAMIAASGWDAARTATPLYDPCCGSGTIAIEAAQIACNIAPGCCGASASSGCAAQGARVAGAQGRGQAARRAPTAPVFGSDVPSAWSTSPAQRRARRRGEAIEFRGGDALQRMPPATGRA